MSTDQESKADKLKHGLSHVFKLIRKRKEALDPEFFKENLDTQDNILALFSSKKQMMIFLGLTH